jgi:hypothetical protein
MAEDGKCSRWRGRLKLGGLPFLNSPAFVDPSAGLRPRIKWLGVFRDGEGHLVQVWTKPRTQKSVQRIMDEIFRGWIEGLEMDRMRESSATANSSLMSPGSTRTPWPAR